MEHAHVFLNSPRHSPDDLFILCVFCGFVCVPIIK